MSVTGNSAMSTINPVPLGNLSGMVVYCDECQRMTSHNGAWHRLKLTSEEPTP